MYTNVADTIDAAAGLVRLRLFIRDSFYAAETLHALAHAVSDEPRLCLLFQDSCAWNVSLSGETNVTLGPDAKHLYALPYDTARGVVLTDFIGLPDEATFFTASFVWNDTDNVLTRERTRKGTTWDPYFVYRTSMRLMGNDTIVAKNVVAVGTALERTAPFVYSLDCMLPPCDREAFTIVEDYGDNHTISVDASWGGELRRFAIYPHETKIGQIHTYPYDAYVSLPYQSRNDASHVTYTYYGGHRLTPYVSVNEDGNIFFSSDTFTHLED